MDGGVAETDFMDKPSNFFIPSLKKCFICNEPQLSVELTTRSLNNHGVLPTNEEKSNILRILCQLLHVKWDLISNIFDEALNFPFCATCVSVVMQLIGLREKLVQVETEMLDKIRALEVTIAETHLALAENDQFRNIFRKQALKEYTTKELLREKINELKEMCGVEGNHIIEIEPSFVQLHLGMSMLRQNPKQQPSEIKLSKKNENVEKNDVDTKDHWMEKQNGPLTRLRLSTAIPRVKDEPILRDPLAVDDNDNGDSFPNISDEFPQESKEETGNEDNAAEEQESDYQVEEDEDDDSDYKESTRRTRSGVRKTSKNFIPRRSTTVEEFAEIEILEGGRRFFEGVEIIWKNGVSEPGRGHFILECGTCAKEIDQRQAKSHQRCPYRMMQIHIKAKHLQAYKCHICNKSLSDSRQLRLHIEKRHPPGGRKRKARVFGTDRFPPEVTVLEDGRVVYENVEIIRIDRDTEDYDVECGSCGKILNKGFARKNKQCPYRQMVNHIKGAHSKAYSCIGCGKSYTNPKSLQKHMITKHSDHPPDWPCDVCGKPMLNARYMQKHKWSHKNAEEKAAALAAGEKGPLTYAEIMEKRRLGGGPTFQCSECGKTFHFMANLRRHEHVHQKDIKNHQCTQCGKFYGTAESLNSHIKYIHESERVHKKYRCRFCEKWFVTKSPWLKHERTHTKDIPYFCPMCNKGFALKQSMMNHVRNKKCTTGRDPPNPRPRKAHHEHNSQPSRTDETSSVESNESGGNQSTVVTPVVHQQQIYVPSVTPVLPLPRRETLQTGISNIPGIGTAIANFPFTSYPRPFDQPYLQQHYDNYM